MDSTFIFLLWITLIQSDCPYQECFCFGGEIQCDGRNFKEIPQKLNISNVDNGILNFDRNQISTIPAGSLPGNISTLSLQDNPTETIDVSAFDESINTLTSLSISGAKFTRIPAAIFRLKQLTEFNLYQTNILVWDEDAMRDLGATLQAFNLGAVGLTSWPDWLTSFSHLTELIVTSNSISSLPDDALDKVASTLTKLALMNNSLVSVPKTLSKMTALKLLSLEQNRISDITWLPRLCNLTQLTLNGNQISDANQLSSALHVHADTMDTFAIHDNILTSIPDMSFLKRVTSLDYTNNHISDPNSGVIPGGLTDLQLANNFLPSIPRIFKTLMSAQILPLNYNRIVSLQASDFPSSTRNVDLEHNLIVELTDTSFPENSNITSLVLSFNPISRISLSAFDNLPRLQQLKIQHTKLTRLPLAIASLTQLSYIDVTGNAGLVCTCMEKSLEHIFSPLSSYTVVGDCGQTSLYNFFSELSPNCPSK